MTNNYGDICKAVRKLKRQYGESDPFRLCRAMGILLNFVSLGRDEDAIKGFFIYQNRIPVITINSDLPQVIQRIIAAHELGHAMLHKKRGSYAFHEVALFDEAVECEKDANFFAAEFLLDDEDVVETLNGDYTFSTCAAILRVPMELLDFKFRVMKWKGYKMMESPISSRSNFLRDMEVPDNADYND